eukprot:29436-Pelagococcus_subviridis.AAC.1
MISTPSSTRRMTSRGVDTPVTCRGLSSGSCDITAAISASRVGPGDSPALRVVPYEAMSGWSSKASVDVERRRGRGLKARGGRRETTANVLKDRRSPRERGRMGTSV